MEITRDLIAEHGLSASEYETILKILGRTPNLTELGVFSVMWSEHCSYKSSKIHLKKFPTQGEVVIQGPGENAGIIDIGDGDAIAFKMESHNHPSFIEPYQGAATGVGGILRDVFTMGARPIANLNSLRFGNPNHPKTAFLVSGVVAGIGGYGNCVGVPTVGGEVYFDDCYNGNILVNAMTVGLVKKDQIFYGYATGAGNPVIYVGSKTGRDGIHGATMASDSFDEESEQKRPTVQVGDPFLEKLLLEACLEVMQTGAIVGIQDMGAAGLTSSSFEMASRAGTGIQMNLDLVPQREEGMSAYEILLSESQERMLMVVAKGRENEVIEIFEKWDLDAVVVGQVTDNKRMVIEFHNETVVDLPIDPLALASPEYDRPQAEPKDLANNAKPVTVPEPESLEEALHGVLSSPTIASKKWVYTQYDSQVMTGTITGPNSDAACVRIRNTNKAVALTVGCNSRYVYLNPFEGAKQAVAECGRNLVCSGAKPLAITDCLNFGNPEKPEYMWQFAKACEGLSEACQKLNTPVVSGNVSLYNETHDQGIFPTPTVGMVGLIKDVSQRVASGFQNENDLVILLGETKSELGGSEYLKWALGKIQGPCPVLNLEQEKTLWEVLQNLNEAKVLESAHDLSEGGFFVSLIEACLEKCFGCRLNIQSSLRWDHFFFSETQSRALISIHPQNQGQFEKIVSDQLAYQILGTTQKQKGQCQFNGEILFDTDLKPFFESYETGFEKTLFSKSL